MIVAFGDGDLRLITQHDHAALAAELLSLWKYGGVADHRFRAQILWAVRQHDNGWREADAAPSLDADGRPFDYRTTPDAARREIWLRGCERHARTSPLANLLVIEHGLKLHHAVRGEDEWQPFFARIDEMRSEALARQPDGEALLSTYPYLQRADGLSLALCEGVSTADIAGGYVLSRVANEAEPAPSRYRLEPFPFAGTTRFRVAARRLEDQAWNTALGFRSALARAPWRQVEFVVEPPSASC